MSSANSHVVYSLSIFIFLCQSVALFAKTKTNSTLTLENYWKSRTLGRQHNQPSPTRIQTSFHAEVQKKKIQPGKLKISALSYQLL